LGGRPAGKRSPQGRKQSGREMAGTRVDADRLRLELARRGWYECDLAVAAEISAATVTAALQGKAISARTLRKIALALTKAPVLDQLDALLLEAKVP
jgi:hypothetical protein